MEGSFSTFLTLGSVAFIVDTWYGTHEEIVKKTVYPL